MRNAALSGQDTPSTCIPTHWPLYHRVCGCQHAHPPLKVELIRSLTKTKPEERASCDDALRSTWLSEQGAK
eukprot:scaffold298059_cov33-Tisochrysis_lutea.AAC.4